MAHQFRLPISSKTVEIEDVKKADGHMLMKARMLADSSISSGIYVLSMLCKIDGESVTAEEILDLDMEDVLAMEDEYIKLKKKLVQSRPKQ
ncbi:hypothetical protein IJV79_00110 [bacterium]|nr:hypothetical protein [bacterium]